MKYLGTYLLRKVFAVNLKCTFNWCPIFNLATYCKAFEKRTFSLISPRHSGINLSVFLQGRAQPSESFSGSVINKGISSLALPSAGCSWPVLLLVLNSQLTGESSCRSQLSLPTFIINWVGQMPALKKMHRTNSCNYGIRG